MMTMGEFLNKIITEIGDTTEGYDWFEVKPGEQYEFNTENRSYEVLIDPGGKESLYVSFMPKSSPYGESPFQTVTDDGDMFKVTATVFNIVEYVWNNKEEIYRDGKSKKYVAFTGSPKPEKDASDDTSRAKLYKSFIKSRFPNTKIRNRGENYFIYPNER